VSRSTTRTLATHKPSRLSRRTNGSETAGTFLRLAVGNLGPGLFNPDLARTTAILMSVAAHIKNVFVAVLEVYCAVSAAVFVADHDVLFPLT
jgi:hypothetical protein